MTGQQFNIFRVIVSNLVSSIMRFVKQTPMPFWVICHAISSQHPFLRPLTIGVLCTGSYLACKPSSPGACAYHQLSKTLCYQQPGE